MNKNWRCPTCGCFTTLNSDILTVDDTWLNSQSKYGSLKARVISISCPNDECRELSVETSIAGTKRIGRVGGGSGSSEYDTDDVKWQKTLLPDAKFMPLPMTVPDEVRITYQEAVLVSAVSGRAGAAMARRCLQGIVRDFFNIPTKVRGNLGAELAHVKESIDPDLWEDIQTLRSVGDIGAHMDKNVDQIIDVSPKEAALLINLIETLFAEWYVAREKRLSHRNALRELMQDKRQAQKQAKNAKPGKPETPEGD
jgi:hypothetical protein|nr:DUF4145 domain-containing protein [Neorhizobium tomejilense]